MQIYSASNFIPAFMILNNKNVLTREMSSLCLQGVFVEVHLFRNINILVSHRLFSFKKNNTFGLYYLKSGKTKRRKNFKEQFVFVRVKC